MSTNEVAVAKSLGCIGAWIERHAPPEFFPLYRTPASPEAIAQAERVVGAAFHPLLRDMLLFANGATANAPSLIDAFKPMTVDDIVSAHRFLTEEFLEGRNIERDDNERIRAANGVRPIWWSARWIPFMQNGGGDYLCVDMDPARGGNVGQVVTYYHDESFRPKTAEDIGAMFARVAEGLDTGAYKFDPENEMIYERC